MLKGPTALAWSRDPVAVAKTAVDFAKTNEKFVVIGGALGTQTLDAAGIRALADLPSLDTLRAQLGGDAANPRHADRQACCRRRPASSRGSSGPMPRRTRRQPRLKRLSRLSAAQVAEFGHRTCMEATRDLS